MAARRGRDRPWRRRRRRRADGSAIGDRQQSRDALLAHEHVQLRRPPRACTADAFDGTYARSTALSAPLQRAHLAVRTGRVARARRLRVQHARKSHMAAPPRAHRRAEPAALHRGSAATCSSRCSRACTAGGSAPGRPARGAQRGSGRRASSGATVTAGSLLRSRARRSSSCAQKRAAGGPVRLYCTVGVHPTRALEFLADGARAETRARAR